MLESLRQKPEHVRHRYALSSALIISLFIFSGWFYSKGFFGGTTPTSFQKENTSPTSLNLKMSAKNNSPFDTTKLAVSGTLAELKAQYGILKESVASVLVPFMTGI